MSFALRSLGFLMGYIKYSSKKFLYFFFVKSHSKGSFSAVFASTQVLVAAVCVVWRYAVTISDLRPLDTILVIIVVTRHRRGAVTKSLQCLWRRQKCPCYT